MRLIIRIPHNRFDLLPTFSSVCPGKRLWLSLCPLQKAKGEWNELQLKITA